MSGNGDTNMSSPSTPGSEMFPAANEQIPNASPPNSQEAQMPDATNGLGLSSSLAQEAFLEDEPELTENLKTKEPGWAWTNKQAQEEYARAYDMAVDKDFPEKLKEYGDVLEDQS